MSIDMFSFRSHILHTTYIHKCVIIYTAYTACMCKAILHTHRDYTYMLSFVCTCSKHPLFVGHARYSIQGKPIVAIPVTRPYLFWCLKTCVFVKGGSLAGFESHQVHGFFTQEYHLPSGNLT